MDPYTFKVGGGWQALSVAEHLLQTHGRAGGMAIAIAILADVLTDSEHVPALEEVWIARFT